MRGFVVELLLAHRTAKKAGDHWDFVLTELWIVLTLSPQIVALAQVRTLNNIPLNVCHVCELRIALMNLVSGSSLEAPISGI